jgi:hypothetical protein
VNDNTGGALSAGWDPPDKSLTALAEQPGVIYLIHNEIGYLTARTTTMQLLTFFRVLSFVTKRNMVYLVGVP